MATARAPSSARNRASRLATTVAREIELLATRRERVRERQEALRAQLDDLADQLGELDRRRSDLDRILGEESASPTAAPPKLIGGAALRRHAVAHLLASGQHNDIHYRTLYEQLAADGLIIRGADPAATFLTNVARSPLIERGERPGTYRLAPLAAQRIETLLVKARHRLRLTTATTADRRTERMKQLRALIRRLERVQTEIAECHRLATEQTQGDRHRPSRASESKPPRGQ
jgi:hypothetical protein